MNDELSDDIKKKFMLSLTIELQDHKKVLHNAPVSPTETDSTLTVLPSESFLHFEIHKCVSKELEL